MAQYVWRPRLPAVAFRRRHVYGTDSFLLSMTYELCSHTLVRTSIYVLLICMNKYASVHMCAYAYVCLFTLPMYYLQQTVRAS